MTKHENQMIQSESATETNPMRATKLASKTGLARFPVGIRVHNIGPWDFLHSRNGQTTEGTVVSHAAGYTDDVLAVEFDDDPTNPIVDDWGLVPISTNNLGRL